MLRGTNASRRSEWVERLERFAKSGQSVSEFCRAEGVSLPSYYQWKRKLAGIGRVLKVPAKRGRRRGKQSAFQPVRLSVANVACGASVRLPNGIVIELGSNPAVVETIVVQLLTHSSSQGAKAC